MERRQTATGAVSPIEARLSIGLLGGVVAEAVWALGWVAVAVVAVHHARATLTASAVLGAAVSVSVAAGGCWVAWRGRFSNFRWRSSASPAQSISRRAVGWVATIGWCAAGAAWNIGVFGLLFRAAAQGRGMLLTVLVIWSAVGWLLLHILFICVGSAIDSVIEAGAERGRNGLD